MTSFFLYFFAIPILLAKQSINKHFPVILSGLEIRCFFRDHKLDSHFPICFFFLSEGFKPSSDVPKMDQNHQ